MPFSDKKGLKKLVVLFIDGHCSHLTIETSNICSQYGIVLVALHRNSTCMLQPAEVSVFKQLKDGWKKTLQQWRFNNYPEQVIRITFSPILNEVLKKRATAGIIKNRFHAIGIYPFCVINVDFDKT